MANPPSDTKPSFKLHKVQANGKEYLITEGCKAWKLMFESKKQPDDTILAAKLLKYAEEAANMHYVYEKIVQLRKKYEI